jgi:hypothetical protein
MCDGLKLEIGNWKLEIGEEEMRLRKKSMKTKFPISNFEFLITVNRIFYV